MESHSEVKVCFRETKRRKSLRGAEVISASLHYMIENRDNHETGSSLCSSPEGVCV